MRTVGILVLSLSLGIAGCKNKGDAATRDPEALKAQQQLAARRDALLAEQRKMQEQSKALQAKIDEGKAKGEDVAELTKQKDEIDKKIEGSETEIDHTSDQLTSISSKLDAAAGIAQREAAVSLREGRVAEREKEVVARMQKLMELDAERAEKWKAGCSAAPAQTIIQQVAAPKGGTYSRKEVDALVAKARTAMSKKGLLAGDLGAQAGLEGEVTNAQKDSDWTRAYVLANELVQTIDAIQINRAFIGAKYQRLYNRVKGAKLDTATDAKLTDGMKEVMQKYGDGDFASANRLINQLWASVK